MGPTPLSFRRYFSFPSFLFSTPFHRLLHRRTKQSSIHWSFSFVGSTQIFPSVGSQEFWRTRQPNQILGEIQDFADAENDVGDGRRMQAMMWICSTRVAEENGQDLLNCSKHCFHTVCKERRADPLEWISVWLQISNREIEGFAFAGEEKKSYVALRSSREKMHWESKGLSCSVDGRSEEEA